MDEFELKKKTNEIVANDKPGQIGTSQGRVLKSKCCMMWWKHCFCINQISIQVISTGVEPVIIKHKESSKEIITHAIVVARRHLWWKIW